MSLPDQIKETKKERAAFIKSQGISGGKGSCPRNNFSEAFRSNYDEIFRKKKPSTLTKRG
jgi:hypothetical protein